MQTIENSFDDTNEVPVRLQYILLYSSFCKLM